MFSMMSDSMALRTSRCGKLLNWKSIWRTKIQEFLERNSSSRWVTTRSKISKNSPTFSLTFGWNYNYPTWAYNSTSEKSKWRHILAHKQEVVITTAVSEVETRFYGLNLFSRSPRLEKQWRIMKYACVRQNSAWRCPNRNYLQLRLCARYWRDPGGYT